MSKLTTLEQLRLLAIRCHAEDEALGARIDAHVKAIEDAGYQNAEQVSAAVSAAITELNIAQYAKQADLETLSGKVTTLEQAGGQPNVIETVKVNGVALTPDANKAVDVTVPEAYDDTALAGRVKAIEDDYLKEEDKYDDTELAGKVNTLIGEDTGKSARAIAAEELAKQLIPENADEALNSLEEIAAWIQAHPDDASAMNLAIAKLEAILAGIGGEGEKATVVAYVNDAIAALSIGDYAKAADLTALAGRVEALEKDTHTHANKTVLDGVTAEKVAAWDAAEQNAKDYVDGMVAEDSEVTAMLTEVFGAAE